MTAGDGRRRNPGEVVDRGGGHAERTGSLHEFAARNLAAIQLVHHFGQVGVNFPLLLDFLQIVLFSHFFLLFSVVKMNE